MLTYEEYYNCAEEKYINGNYKEALQLFKNACSIRETNDCLNYIGCCYLNLKEYLSAIRLFKRLLVLCPNWERPLINLGRMYMSLDKPKKSLKSFEKAVIINPNNEDTYYYLGVYFFKNEDYVKAKMYCEKSLLINENQSDVHLNLGMCYLRLNSFDEAIKEFETAYKYNNACADAIYNKSVALISMKNYQEALKILIALNTLEPEDVEIIMDIAHCYYKIEKYEDSKIWLNKLLSKEPEHNLANKLHKRLMYLTNQTSL